MNCLVCGAKLEGWWRFCLRCGARIDEATAREVGAIDYLLREIPEWHKREIVSKQAEELLKREYSERRAQLILGLKPKPVAKPVEGFSLEPQFTKEDEVLSVLPEERVVVAPKPFVQVVTENINVIFTLASLLLVVGILLYYRHEIYTGLKIPYVQATVLGLFTISCLFTGWTLVKRTQQTLAGRALTVLGSLLVPINPWFMVKAGILKDSGNHWILGSICTLLYLWTAYFLKDRLFIYFGLFAGYLTSISLATKLGVFPSYIAGSLMLTSIVYLLVEGILARSEQYYASPFFNTAHIGVLVCLMFYTPAIRYLPVELVAARLHFDPSIYHFPTAFWLALAATFVYTYSAFRRDRRFIFFAYAALFWGEALLIKHYSAPLSLYVLVMGASALFIRYLSDRCEYDSAIKSVVEIGSRASQLILLVYAIGVHILLFEPRFLPGWAGVAAVGVLGFYSLYLLLRERYLLDLCVFWGCAATVVPFASLKGGTAAYWTPALVMATAAAVLYLLCREGDDRESLHNVVFLALIGLSISHLFRWAEELKYHHLAGISTTLLLSLLAGLRAWRTRHRVEALTLGLLSSISVTAAFFLLLDSLHLYGRGLALMLVAAWSFTLYLATRSVRLGESYGFWATLLNILILLSALVLIGDLQSIYILVGLMLVGGCELLCAGERRSIVDTLLASASGLLLLAHLLIWLKVERTEVATAAFVLLGLCYLWVTFYLERRGYPVAFTLEVVANLTVTAAAVVTIARGLDEEFTKLSLLAPAFSAAFYFYGSAHSRAAYCYLTPFYATATLAIGLDIFFVDRVLTLVNCLIPLVLFWYWLGGRAEKRLQAFALWLMPLLILFGFLDIVSDGVSKELVLLFCSELTVFYLYTALERKSSLLMSVAILSGVFTVYAGLDVVGWRGYTLGAVAIFVVVLSRLSAGLKERIEEELCQVLEWWARSLFFMDTIAVTAYALSEMRLNNHHLNEVIVNMLLVKVGGLILRVSAVDAAIRSAYRACIIYLTTMTYLLVGLRLGFDFWKQNEFYSVPIGLLYLAIGLVSFRERSVMVWVGSFTSTVPMLLHTLSFRFIDRHPSSVHEIGVVVLALLLITTGFMFQLKAPAIFGVASLGICLFSIVFGFVGWEQRWLSITLIVLGVSIFIAAWLIYYFSKGKERVEERKQLLEEFGKWK